MEPMACPTPRIDRWRICLARRVEAHALAATVSHRVILTSHWDHGICAQQLCRDVYHWCGTLSGVSSSRVQVTVDPELAAALAEFGGRSRSRAVRDLAIRGAQALRDDERQRDDAIEFLRRISTGEDDRFDFSVTAELHAARR